LPHEAKRIVNAALNIASVFGHSTSDISDIRPIGLTGFNLASLSCREFFEVFENQIDKAIEVVVEEKKQTTYSLDDLIEMRSEVLNKVLNGIFTELDKNNNGLEVKELEKFLIAKTPLNICQSQQGLNALLSERAVSIMSEFSADGKMLTLKEFLSLSVLLQKLHDKIVVDLFSQN